MRTLFIGLGNMGAPMAGHLRPVTDLLVHDADEAVTRRVAAELGADTLDDAAAGAGGDLDVDAVVLMLPNSRVVEAVLRGDGAPGLFARLRRGALVLDMSSSEPASTQELAREAADRGLRYVDAPVSGGVAKAETGELAIMAGGAADDFEAARPLLAAMGASVIHVGPAGSGHAAKALNNLLSATHVAAAAEVLSVAVRFGIDPAVMVDVLNASTGRSQALEVKYPTFVLTHTWDSGFALDLMVKDLHIATALAADLGVDLDVTATAGRLADEAREAFGAGHDHTELARFVEERNNVDFQATSGN